MNQEECVQKLLEDFQTQRPMSDDLKEIVTHYLHLSFAVGMDYGIAYKNNMQSVGQYLNGKLVKSYISISSAARVLKMNRTTIKKSITNNSKTKNGYEWKYI